MAKKHKYCTDCTVHSHAIVNFNKMRSGIEELHQCKIKVIKMYRIFLEYIVEYELVKGE